MPHMPCDIIGFDLQDSMGNNIEDFHQSIKKHRLGRNQNAFITLEAWSQNVATDRDKLTEVVLRELQNEQGCRLEGYFQVLRVPGNFHIGHHSHEDIVQRVQAEGYQLDNSFKIIHLSFGFS